MGETVSFLRAPDAGDPHVRCDEREQETEPGQTGLRRRSENCAKGHREATATAPVLDSTQVFTYPEYTHGTAAWRGAASSGKCSLVPTKK